MIHKLLFFFLGRRMPDYICTFPFPMSFDAQLTQCSFDIIRRAHVFKNLQDHHIFPTNQGKANSTLSTFHLSPQNTRAPIFPES